VSIPIETDDAKTVANTDDAVEETSPLEDLGIFQRELRKLIHDQLQLAVLEVRLATHSLMAMIAAAVCIGALLVLVWIGLMAATGLSLIGMGLQPVFVLLTVTALTAVPILLLRGFIVRRSRQLGFPATLRTLKSSPPGTQNTKSI
jgi:hypothetical protein